MIRHRVPEVEGTERSLVDHDSAGTVDDTISLGDTAKRVWPAPSRSGTLSLGQQNGERGI